MSMRLSPTLTILVSALASCTSSPDAGSTSKQIVVTLGASERGTPEARLPLSFTQPRTVVVDIEARRADGARDTSFNGFVRVTSRPGAVQPIGPQGRSVQLVAGVATNVAVPLLAAYGDTRLWVEEDGNVPVDVNRDPPPACANGRDDDADGELDFPGDPGCASPLDDTEGGGTYAAGVSEVLYFVQPRIADVRGETSRGAATPFLSEQVSVDTGFRPSTNDFAFDTVVTRISTNGFYATDLGDAREYRSIFSFTFSTPPGLRVCDRLKTFNGTATQFFGMTQIASPTWTVELWNPNKRPCLVPEPALLGLDDVGSTDALFRREAALVRVATEGNVIVTVAARLGRGMPQRNEDGAFAFSPDATNCDLNRNGMIDRQPGSPEQACDDQCKLDATCSEYSNFAAQANFMLTLTDTVQQRSAKIPANAGGAPRFNPLLARGKPIRAFSGTLEYFSGGSQFTIEARCDDDVIADPAGAPLPSDRACVRPRTERDNNEASQ